MSVNTLRTTNFLRSPSDTSSFFNLSNSSSTNLIRASPVIPSLSSAQSRHRKPSGMVLPRYSGRNSHSISLASKAFRNRSQVICSIYCASPFKPASLRMMSSSDLIKADIAIVIILLYAAEMAASKSLIACRNFAIPPKIVLTIYT